MDHLDNPLFESALLKSGCSPADIGAFPMHDQVEAMAAIIEGLETGHG